MKYVIVPEESFNEMIEFIGKISEFIYSIKFIPINIRKDFRSAYKKFYDDSFLLKRETR